MNHLSIFDLPDQLRDISPKEDDVNILIGENGSGKSSVLKILSQYFSHSHINVIAIANTIYDKFPNSKKLNILKPSSGKTIASKAIINILKLISTNNNELKGMRNIANTLVYVGFNPTIRFEFITKSNFEETIDSSDLNDDKKKDLLNLMYFLKERYELNFIEINFRVETFHDIKNSFLLSYFKHETELKKLGLWILPKIYFKKNGELIPILQASSGELTLISSLIYISTVISTHSIILIDEPENSLHPKWQIEYVKKLIELFYLYQPKIIIATHSPLVLNGAEVNIENVNIYKGTNGIFHLHQNKTTNVEEIYQDAFDVTTPQNRFISEDVVAKMNLLSSKKISQSDFETYVNGLITSSYDENQQKAFEGIIQLSREVSKEISR